jgi:large subunit ribosomal protein L37e
MLLSVKLFLEVTGWGEKVARRRGEGSGRMRHLKAIPRKAKNGFRTGT